MATPLAQLLQDVIHEPEIRAQFAASPESFLADHGYEHLDAADLREALYVLADGAAPDAAAGYQAGGDAIDADTDPAEQGGLAGAAAGLLDALAGIGGALLPIELSHDPSHLDDTDDTDDEAGAARHGERTAAGVDDAETDADTDDLATDGPVARPALDDHEIAPAGDAGVSDELADLDLDLDAPTGAAVAGAEAGIDLYDGLPDLADAGQVLGEPPADLDLGDQPAPGDAGDGWDDVI